MDGFEINKIVAAVIIGVLLVFGVGKFTDYLFYVEKPAQPAYVVEAPVLKVSSSSNNASTVDIAKLLSMGTVEHGQKVFKKCSACHVVAKGGKNKIGPALYGVMGRKSASISDYKYSKALIAHSKTWSYDEMNAYLIKPQARIKGTKMAFAGLKSEKDRASVMLYMNSKSDNPLTKP